MRVVEIWERGREGLKFLCSLTGQVNNLIPPRQRDTPGGGIDEENNKPPTR